MSLVVNHNLMAANTARNLSSHYANLATSTQRLSTGLRINSAADDAAGLAIRELQRADIAALQQGARNANDAISLIQTADGALGIIDEKLIRMKELAEQAATGTYDSTQRLMIESEYQQMASEITRIANATDFNGIKLLDGTLSADEHDGSGMDATGKMKIHFGSGNDSAEDYYYIQIGEATAQAFGLGDASTWEDATGRIVNTFATSVDKMIKEIKDTGEYDGVAIDTDTLEAIKQNASTWADELKAGIESLSTFSSAVELSTLYNKFKDDEGVKEISDLFDKSISNYDGITTRERQKMEYALGLAAMKDSSLFTFTGYTPATDVWSAAMDAYDALNDSDTGAIATATAASNTIDSDLTTAATAATAITTASPYAALVPDVVDAVKAATTQINSDLNGTYSGTTSYTDDAGTAYTISFTEAGYITKIETGSYTFNTNGKATSSNFSTANMTTIVNGANNYSVATSSDGTVSITDSSSNQFTLDSDGAIVAMAGSGNSYTVSSDNITSMLDGAGNTVYFDGTGVANNNVTSYTDSTGNSFTFASGSFVSMLDTDGNNFVMSGAPAIGTAATKANFLSITDSSGNVFRLTGGDITSVEYNGKTYNLSITDTSGNKTGKVTDSESNNVYEFNAYGTLIAAHDSSGNNIFETTLASEGILKSVFADAQEKAETLDYAGYTIATQEDAQKALEAINNAIVEKDKIRANLGALQNRLENTISNLNVQAENLQAAESRISDVDVATEMTQFVRNQILTQSAVAMLSQANSLPQMAMQLIGG